MPISARNLVEAIDQAHAALRLSLTHSQEIGP